MGTSCGVPTKYRGLPSVALRKNGELLLFDCGEGTQRQMMTYGLSFMKINRIFITHLHGDHYLGLFGLVQSMSFFGRTDPLEVFGPRSMESVCETVTTIGDFSPGFEVLGSDLSPGQTVDCEGYSVTAEGVRHSVPTLAYVVEEHERPGKFDVEKARSIGIPEGLLYKRLQEGEVVEWQGRSVEPSELMGPPRPGRKVVYIGDAEPTDEIVAIAKSANLLISEGTFCDDLADRAQETGHSTVRQICAIAERASVGRLLLTHFSPRYDAEDIRREVSFQPTLIGRDGMTLEVQYS